MGCCKKRAVETAGRLGERADHLASARTRRDLLVDCCSFAGDVPPIRNPPLPPHLPAAGQASPSVGVTASPRRYGGGVVWRREDDGGAAHTIGGRPAVNSQLRTGTDQGNPTV